MQRVATFICVDCGLPTRRRRRVDRPAVCLECGIARAVGQNIDAHLASRATWDIAYYAQLHPNGAIARLLNGG